MSAHGTISLWMADHSFEYRTATKGKLRSVHSFPLHPTTVRPGLDISSSPRMSRSVSRSRENLSTPPLKLRRKALTRL